MTNQKLDREVLREIKEHKILVFGDEERCSSLGVYRKNCYFPCCQTPRNLLKSLEAALDAKGDT